MLRAWLGDGDYDIEWRGGHGGTRSELGTPLWAAIERFVDELEPGARLAPICVAGFTDSHWLRESFGTVAYGFFPMRAMSPELAARLIHSADERIAVDDLELGVVFLRFRRGDRSPARLFRAWATRRSASAGWRCRTACSSTARPPGRCASARPDGELKVASGEQAAARAPM